MNVHGEVVWLFAFDVGSEILTKVAEQWFARPASPILGGRARVPHDLAFYRPLAVPIPQTVALDTGDPISFEARAYDMGVVTLTARTSLATKSLADLRKFHDPQTADGLPLDEFAGQLCEQVRTTLGEALRNPTPDPRPEAYTAFCLTDLGGERDVHRWLDLHGAEVAGLLSDLEPEAVSPSQAAETLRLRRTLTQTDLVVIDWDAALIVDLVGPSDAVLYVLELANLQLEEWRTLDAILDQHLNRAYDHLGQSPGVRGGRWAAALRELRQLRVDVAKLADQVTNITKFVGDWHLARVYLSARERFHLDGWRASVDGRLTQLDRLYEVVRAEVNDRRMLWLEVLIVVLIAVELLVSFLR